MTLWHWLSELKGELGISELFAAHVNYGLREAANREEAALREMIPDLKVAHFTGDFTEASGRDFRYAFFEKVMAEVGATALVTAHHADDQAETLMMRLITGRRLRYLSGMAARRPFGAGELIRPLLHFRKEELDAPRYFEDETNAETTVLRNRVRNSYLPMLESENPQLMRGLSNLTAEVGRAFTVISDLTREYFGKGINLFKFDTASEALQSFILQDYLAQFTNVEVSKAQFDELLGILRRPGQHQAMLNKSYWAVKSDKAFYVTREAPVPDKLVVLSENPNDGAYLAVNLPDESYEIRKRESADKIMLHGVHRKVKQIFIDEKISFEDREIPLVVCDHEVYAIPALGIVSDLCHLNENAKIVKNIWVKVERSR
jgi:tRNA(Ile)-lysidine synthase